MGLVSVYMGVFLFYGSLLSLLMGLKLLVLTKSVFIEWGVFNLSGGVDLQLIVLADSIMTLFISVVLFVSSMVLVYSSDYMESDSFFYRFIILVSLFVASMILMVASPNMVSILLGWDGLGLVSYCLIIFYQNDKSSSSGMLTVLSNRVGDVAILLGISWMACFGSWNFVFVISLYNDAGVMSMIFMLIILAALTKSAQVPFSAWLPAAMAAPTPVSALVHSSTLVTAGVYLLIRFNEIVGCSKFLFFVSLLTMFLSGVGACFEQDAKKIVALSTLSQLGVMMFSLSMGLWEMAFFHLLSHALFKSLLFMCMGMYIHGMNNQQDLRGIGFQFNSMPIVSSYFLVSSMSLSGFPFLSGFYSSDSIIELFQSSVMGLFSYFLVMVCVLSTVLYSMRLIFSLYAVEMNSSVLVLGVSEYFLSLLPMMLLFVVSVMGGSLFFSSTVPLFMLGFSLFFSGLITLTVVGLILTLSLMLYMSCILSSNLKLGVSGVGLSLMWFLEDFFSLLSGVLGSSSKVLQGVDQGWVEFVGVQGVISNIKKTMGGLNLGTEVGVGIYLYGGLFMVLFIFLM